MRDLDAIIEACSRPNNGNDAAALATVVHVEGSAYRRPGAHMLVYADGRRIGTVSGGCLESDVATHARQVLNMGETEYILYDKSRPNGDVVAELGCNGSVGVLIEPAGSLGVKRALQFLESARASRSRGAMATVYRTEGVDCPRVGDRFFHDGSSFEACDRIPMLGPDLEQAALHERAYSRAYEIEGGVIEVLMEPAVPPVALLICGTGPDTVPLAQAARLLGWRVTTAADPATLQGSRDPASTSGSAIDLTRFDSRTAAVVMTHSYSRDQAWIKVPLPSPIAYVGLLGPRQRSLRLLAEAATDGGASDTEQLARLHSPAGLDLGAETPEEIAVAIVAEIQAVLNRRSAGHLRDRNAPIHSTHATPDYPANSGKEMDRSETR